MKAERRTSGRKKEMNRRNRLTLPCSILVAACTAFSTSCSAQSTTQSAPSIEQKPQSKANSEKFVITGILRSKDGSPVIRKTVYVFLVQDGAAYAKLGMQDGKITVVNPRAASDDKGRFAIDVDPARVKEWQAITKDFTVGVIDGENRPLSLKRGGVQVRFQFDEKNKDKKLDLGELTEDLK
jgi:hypothetical protein